jgi:4'-phosphopantetheinyl transferase
MRHPGPLEPGAPDVHLWTVRLEASEANFARALACLSPEEIARAERFRFDRHRRTFVLGRAALRALLASHLGIAAGEVRFVYGPHGKPALAEASCPVRFNTSNSGDLAAFAFVSGCEIGVDLERHRALQDIERIAERFFSAEETAELLELSGAERTTAFFDCWTRKEAYIKAVGGGLSVPLDSFHVTLRPGVPARLLSLAGSVDAARGWTLQAFTPSPGYAGAIAYPDQPRPVLTGPLVTVDELLDELLGGLPDGLRDDSIPE